MENKRFLTCLVAGVLLSVACAFGQTTTEYFKVNRTVQIDSVATTTIKPVRDTVWIYPDTAAILALKCSTVVQPPTVTTTVQSMYVVLDDVVNSFDSNIAYWKFHKVNEVNLYARAYVTSSSRRAKLAECIAIFHNNGMKVNIDYRLTTELSAWESYFKTYTNPLQRPDGMITEREPYVTGDYAGFYPFLREGKAMAVKLGIKLSVYMGQPTQQAWDSIVFYADKIYLSNYISMSTYNGANGQYRYVASRWGYITNSCKKFGKLDYPVIYIKSLERKAWGAGNDFMGDAYIGGTFYGAIMTQGIEQYNSNATTEQKLYTELLGDCIFHHKYGVLAIPK